MILRTSTSHEEGCRREWSILTKEFRGDANGHVESLVTVHIEWTKDEQGRHVFKEVEGTQEVWPCQLVLLAMGFVGPEKRGPISDLNLEMDPRGNVKADANYMTSLRRRVRRRRFAPRPIARRLGHSRRPRSRPRRR